MNIDYTFLKSIEYLTLTYSTDCNMQCKYCFIEKHNKIFTQRNKDIREALESGSFVQKLIDIYEPYPDLRDQIIGYQFWGAEPTLNGDLFEKTHNDLCNYFTNIQKLMFSTNAYIGGEKIFNNFIQPMLDRCEKTQTPFTFSLQFSIDGPAWLNDKSRRAGATQRTLDAVAYIIDHVPENEYFVFQPSFKATWDMELLHKMLDMNLLQSWYDFSDDLYKMVVQHRGDNSSISLDECGLSPSISSPIIATVDDGKAFAQFIKSLQKIDTSNYLFFKDNPLFAGGYFDMQVLKRNDFQKYDTQIGLGSCSAGKNNWCFDFDGTVYSCHHNIPLSIHENPALSFMLEEHSTRGHTKKTSIQRVWGEYGYHANFMTKFNLFTASVLALVRSNQILAKYAEDPEELIALFLYLVVFDCHLANQEVTGNESIFPFGSIRFWGNGALDALKEYYAYDFNRTHTKKKSKRLPHVERKNYDGSI